jgi:zinc protease
MLGAFMKIRVASRHFYIVSTLALAIAAPFQPAAFAQSEPAVSTDVATPATAWGHLVNDLSPDPTIKFGALPNGMKYAIRKNETPKGGASVRMQFNVGSIAEADDMQGVAHLLEHMAFNGSKNIPEGEMIKMLQRLGLAFGADTNASTGFDRTQYKLDLPKTDAETVDAAMLLMRETASELTISTEALDRERGVILGEQQTRNSMGQRQAIHSLKFALPQTPFGLRFPGGTPEVIKTVTAAKVKAFYQQYYRPENATFVIAGDFDADAIEAKIKATFSSWKGVGAAGPALPRGTVDPARRYAAANFVDPAVATQVELARMSPFKPVADTKAKRTNDLLAYLGSSIINKRLQNKALAADAKILDGSMSLGPQLNAFDQASITVTAKEGAWQDGLSTAEQELRRALQFGVTATELTEELANLSTAYVNAANQQSTRQSRQLVDEILGSIEGQSIVMSPDATLALFNEAKPALTVDAVNAALRSSWGNGPQLLHISTKAPIENLDASAFAVLQASSSVAVTAPEAKADKAFAYDNFGKAGKIKSDKMIADLGIRTIRFANGVQLNLKKTDFEKGVIRYNLRVGSGQLALPKDKPGLGFFLNNMSAVGGLEAHSFEELKRLLAGKSVAMGLQAGEDNFGSSGATTAQDLALQFKLLAGFAQAPGYRPEADTLWQNAIPSFAAQLDAVPQAVAGTVLPRVLASGDPRFGIPAVADLQQRNMAEVAMAVDAQLKSGPVEIAIVGDFDEAAAINAVAGSFGALPKRSKTAAMAADALTVKFPSSPEPLTLYHKGKDDQGMVTVQWPTTDDGNHKLDTTFTLLGQILELQLLDVVREKLGATYSPNAGSNTSDIYPGYGFMQIAAVAEPAKMDLISNAVKEIAKELRDAPISEDLLLRARKPILERFEKSERENGGWITPVSIAQSKPARLDRRRNRAALLSAVTPADIQAAAQQYLTDAALLEVRIVATPPVGK